MARCRRKAAHERDRQSGIEKDDFELFSLAVSAMNGCGMCIDSHERVLQQHGVKAETIQAAARSAQSSRPSRPFTRRLIV
jgi:AhpD family alkylhydroperoxidase